MRLFGLLIAVTATCGAAVVAVDCYHNDEKPHPDHYRWEGTYQGGYSKLGDVLRALSAELRTVREPLTAAALKGIDVFLIADPDTPAETPEPKYINSAEIDALAKWVRAGGRLVLFGNDKGNTEFEHFNKLATRFGIEFVETIYRNAEGKSKLNLISANSILGKGLTAYFVDVAPLKLSDAKAQILLSDGATPIMALVPHGKGRVLALGDPWIYNEYIDSKDNRQMATNLFRELLK